MILPDLLTKNLEIIFCGTAASNVSAEVKSYYAGPGNQFYPILFKTGLTSTLISPINYSRLLNYNIGLTDIAKGVSGNDNEIGNDDFDVDGLILNIRKYQPRIVCFNGKTAGAVFLYNDKTKTRKVKYGWMDEKIDKTRLFIAPSTSGSGRRYWNEYYWIKLKKELEMSKN